MKYVTWIGAAAGCILAGCAVGPKYQRPSVLVPASLPGQAAPESASLADMAWWQVFSDPELVALIKEALANNNDLRTAVSRVEESRSLAAVARSEYYPLLGYEAGVQRDHGVYRSHPELSLPANGRTQNLFLAGLSLFWEADVWGRIRRSNQAALADFLASEQGRRGVMLSLVSEVAQAYFELQELDRRLAIARDSTTAFQSTHALFNRRFHAGITSLLAVKRAESALADALGTMASIELQISVKEHQICVLLGRNPGGVRRGAPDNMSQLPPVIPAGVPSALLERRPDLLQAEQALAGASARIGVARADFFPRIGLTALFGRVSPELSTLTSGSAGVAVLAAGGAGPVFTGGQLTGQYRAVIAIFEQAKFQYAQQVLKAFQEVSDALISGQKIAEVEEEQKRQVAALTDSVAIATKRYRGGLASYYEVLEAQQLLFPAEIALSQIRRDRLLAVVHLYKALGGGWQLSDEQWLQGHR